VADVALDTAVRAGLARARAMLAAASDTLRLGHFDNAVSRAYYACFHAAEAALRTEGQEPRSHEGVKNLFGFLLAKPGKLPRELGKILSDLKNGREEGDYALYVTITAEDAAAAVRDAERFVSEVTAYLVGLGFAFDP
jgi:uncharacterized protein (UPF0332 family)